MPTYDYECSACKAHFEIFHSINETRKKCPKCGAQRLVRQFGPGSGFIFRGSGFYITDYRNPDYRAKAESEKKGPSSSSTEKSESKSSPPSPPDGGKSGKKKASASKDSGG